MKRLFLYLILIIISCDSIKEKSHKSVAEYECVEDNSITPQMVEKNPLKFQGRCFTWYGKVFNVSETEGGNMWLFDEIENCEFAYYGNCDLTLRFNKKGTKQLRKYGYSGVSFWYDSFVFDGNTEDIFKDDIVKIRAAVIGKEVKKHPRLKGKFLHHIIFAVYDIQKI